MIKHHPGRSVIDSPIREPQLRTFLGRASEPKLLHLGRPSERSGPKRSSGCDDLGLPGKPFKDWRRRLKARHWGWRGTGRDRFKLNPIHKQKNHSQKISAWVAWIFDLKHISSSFHLEQEENETSRHNIIMFIYVSHVSKFPMPVTACR